MQKVTEILSEIAKFFFESFSVEIFVRGIKISKFLLLIYFSWEFIATKSIQAPSILIATVNCI